MNKTNELRKATRTYFATSDQIPELKLAPHPRFKINRRSSCISATVHSNEHLQY